MLICAYLTRNALLVPGTAIVASHTNSLLSYDADESANKPEEAAKLEIPEPSIAPAPVHNGYDLNQIPIEVPQEITQNDNTNGNYPNGQDGDPARNWSNGQTDRNHSNRYEDGPSEPHGIGIKEDG